MGAGIFASLANGVLGWAGSLIANETAKADREQALDIHNEEMSNNNNQAQINRDFQRNERLESQEYELDMWNRNNEYNSPVEQLKRYKEAGINPNSLNGIKPVASSPLTTTPMSGSQASYSSNLASAMLSRSPNMLSSISSMIGSIAGARKAASEAQLNEYNLSWNRKTEPERLEELRTNIKYQHAQINGILSKAGLDEASTNEIVQRTSWISKLSQAELDLKVQELTNLYNDNQETLHRIKESNQRIKESESRTTLIDTQTSIAESDSLQEKYDTSLKILEKDFATCIGLPLNTDDEKFYWHLWKSGQLPNFIDEVTIPMERSTWKPKDYYVPRGNYAVGFNSRTGYFNPTWRSTFNAEFDASNPLRFFKR